MIGKIEKKTCQNCKGDFVIEPDDFSFYEKMKVPPPTFCPDCRFQRRLAVRNNRVFYRNVCAICAKEMLSLYGKNSPFTVYCRDCWLGDSWNPLSYGQDYDFFKPFFLQFAELQKAVPRVNMYRDNFVLSEYCNYGLDFKECYLLFGGKDNERIYFGNQVIESRDSMDVSFSEKVEYSYEVFECARANKLFFSRYSQDSIDSRYLIDCRNCSNCFGCVGLINKQYHIYNKARSKEEYERFMVNHTGSYEKHLEALKKLRALELALPHRYARIYKSTDSDGDDLSEAKNTHSAWSTRQAENSKYLFFCRNKSSDCYDCSFQGYGAEMLYEIAHGFSGSNTAFNYRNLYNHDAQYNEECKECSYVFGCVGLRNKKYCILNKQYSKEEYEDLLPKIKKHMNEMPFMDKKGRTYRYGEFFPIELSPFAYNETIAQEYFSLLKEEAVKEGYRWEEGDARNYMVDISAEELPDNIADATEEIVHKIVSCAHAGTCKEQCTEAFKIIPEEFEFYKRMNIVLPRLCPNCRHFQRISQRNPLRLWKRNCMCGSTALTQAASEHFHGKGRCTVEFKTSYAPERPEIVYCEKCYQQEIY